MPIVANCRDKFDNFMAKGYKVHDASIRRVNVGLVAHCVYVTVPS
jgi:hypothetical protein